MDEKQMLGCAYDLRSDLKYAFEQGEGQTPDHKDVQVIDWLIGKARIVRNLQESLVTTNSIALDKHVRDSKDWFSNQTDLIEEKVKLQNKVEELEKQWELFKIELQERLDFQERCFPNDDAEINLIHDIQSIINKIETGDYFK